MTTRCNELFTADDIDALTQKITAILQYVSKARSHASQSNSSEPALMVSFGTLMQQLKLIVTQSVTLHFLDKEKGKKPAVDIPGESMAAASTSLVYPAIVCL